jgi:DNA-binding transcriptional MerR regulator/methylmalonyl-CoA mutase cobalamin-binding subunit
VTPEVLRAWERRYGVVVPERTASGYRLYDDGAIALLRTMRRLIDQGWTASSAAQHLLAVPDAGESTDPAGAQADAMATEMTRQFVDAASRMNAAAVEAALDEMLSRASFEVAVDRYLFPALRALGDAWAEGNLSVAAEHAASAAVQRRLGAAFDAAGSGMHDEAPVLVGLAPGARHEFGALAFAVAARRAGLPVEYLGPDLPVEDWERAGRETGAQAVVIGVPTEGDVAAGRAVARGLERDGASRVVVAFGGDGSTSLPRSERLPEGLSAAVDELRNRLGTPLTGGT